MHGTYLFRLTHKYVKSREEMHAPNKVLNIYTLDYRCGGFSFLL